MTGTRWIRNGFLLACLLVGASPGYGQTVGFPACRVSANDPNVLIPLSSIEKPEDRGLRMHTNVLIYSGGRSGPDGGLPLLALWSARGPLPLSTVSPPFDPSQIQTAYEGGTTTTAGSNAIAIIDAYDYASALSDFNSFSSHFGLPQESSSNPTASNSRFQVIYAGGSEPSSDSGWNLEEALDIEWAHSMAPGAKIYLVEANSSSFADLFTAISVAKTLPGVKEISMSWSGGEFGGETAYDSSFTGAFAYFASSGDVGGARGYPAESPNVVSVGGTSLTLSAGGGYGSESAWSDSGGGPSYVERTPSYQSAIASKLGGMRGGPDISAVADPNTGVFVYMGGGWYTVGGTSLSCPVCAGLTNAGGSTQVTGSLSELDFIYAHTSGFHDVTSGSSGSFNAGAGWDFVSGWGSPLSAASLNSTLTLTLTPSTVVAGTTASGKVTLGSAAPTGGAVVDLSSDSACGTAPVSITVPSGQKSATFSITTSAVNSSSSADITATYGATSQTQTLTVDPLQASTLTLAPATAVGGSSTVVTGTVTLNGKAPTGGVVVTLGSSNSSAASVQASVTVPAGSTSKTFSVTTHQVSSQQSATITATYGDSVTANETVNPFAPASLTLTPSSLAGGLTSSAKVTVNATVSGAPLTLSLASACSAATVPATVNVPVGSSSATFTVTTSAITTAASGQISATANGITVGSNLTVNVATLSTLQLSGTSVIGSCSSTVTGTVTLTGPAPAGGASVSLGSSNSNACSVPATVMVSGGAAKATFNLSQAPVNGSTPVTISATLGVTKTASISVLPASLLSLVLSPTSTFGGSGTVNGTVNLNAPAGPAGAVVALSSSSSLVASVPASVTVASGATSASFTVTTSSVTSNRTVTINGNYQVSHGANLSVLAYMITALSVTPTSIQGDSSTTMTGTVTLNGAAPTGGIMVTLTSSNTNACTVPATVTVSAGSTQATFTVSQLPVGVKASVTVSGSYNAKKSAVVTITP